MKKEIKNIRNDALVKAYQVMHDNPTQERQDAVTRQMIRARFLLPVIPVKGKLPEDFPARTLQNEKGEQYLPLFTDMDELRSQQQVIGQSMLIVDISDAYAYLVEHEELKGVIVNPFAKPNLICGRPMCEQLAKLWSRVRTAELNGEDPEAALRPRQQNVKLLVPREYPDGVVFTLSAGLRAQEDVEKAWMCMVQKEPDDRPEDRDWMVILQAASPLKGREDAFRAIGESLAPYIGARNVIFMEHNPGLAGLTDQAAPIYCREDGQV